MASSSNNPTGYEIAHLDAQRKMEEFRIHMSEQLAKEHEKCEQTLERRPIGLHDTVPEQHNLMLGADISYPVERGHYRPEPLQTHSLSGNVARRPGGPGGMQLREEDAKVSDADTPEASEDVQNAKRRKFTTTSNTAQRLRSRLESSREILSPRPRSARDTGKICSLTSRTDEELDKLTPFPVQNDLEIEQKFDEPQSLPTGGSMLGKIKMSTSFVVNNEDEELDNKARRSAYDDSTICAKDHTDNYAPLPSRRGDSRGLSMPDRVESTAETLNARVLQPVTRRLPHPISPIYEPGTNVCDRRPVTANLPPILEAYESGTSGFRNTAHPSGSYAAPPFGALRESTERRTGGQEQGYIRAYLPAPCLSFSVVQSEEFVHYASRSLPCRTTSPPNIPSEDEANVNASYKTYNFHRQPRGSSNKRRRVAGPLERNHLGDNMDNAFGTPARPTASSDCRLIDGGELTRSYLHEPEIPSPTWSSTLGTRIVGGLQMERDGGLEVDVRSRDYRAPSSSLQAKALDSGQPGSSFSFSGGSSTFEVHDAAPSSSPLL